MDCEKIKPQNADNANSHLFTELTGRFLKNSLDITREDIKDWLTGETEVEPSLQDIVEAEEVLVDYAQACAIAPPARLRSNILTKIMGVAQERNRQPLDLDNLPPLDETANWMDWEAAVAGIEPPEEYDNIHLHPLESNEKRELFVAWVKEMVEEEVHHDLLESFLILEGSCECTITAETGETRIVRLSQGDFITLEIGESHNIRITSEKPTKAILQWLKLAA